MCKTITQHQNKASSSIEQGEEKSNKVNYDQVSSSIETSVAMAVIETHQMTQASTPKLPNVEEDSEGWTKILGRKAARKIVDHSKAKNIAVSNSEETGIVTKQKDEIPPDPSQQ